MRSGKQILEHIQTLREEIRTLSMLDSEQRLSRDFQISWKDQMQHEARLARIEAIRQEIADLMVKSKV
jgi:hypothetical protein